MLKPQLGCEYSSSIHQYCRLKQLDSSPHLQRVHQLFLAPQSVIRSAHLLRQTPSWTPCCSVCAAAAMLDPTLFQCTLRHLCTTAAVRVITRARMTVSAWLDLLRQVAQRHRPLRWLDRSVRHLQSEKPLFTHHGTMTPVSNTWLCRASIPTPVARHRLLPLMHRPPVRGPRSLALWSPWLLCRMQYRPRTCISALTPFRECVEVESNDN